ncbi:MAG: 3'-5' exonuclease [Pseudomonadota bacterium]
MFDTLRRRWYHRRLRDPAGEVLFQTPPPDEVVCLDCEASSLDPRKADILSIAALRIRNNRILTSEALRLTLRPRGEVNPDSIRIHGLRNIDLQTGIPPETAIRRVVDFIGARPLVGYYLEYDITLLNTLLRPWLGIPLPNPRIEVSGLYHDRKMTLIPQGFIDLRFDSLLKDLKLPQLPKHDAYNDALMTAMIYLSLRGAR